MSLYIYINVIKFTLHSITPLDSLHNVSPVHRVGYSIFSPRLLLCTTDPCTLGMHVHKCDKVQLSTRTKLRHQLPI